MQRQYCGHFAALEIGAVKQQMTCSDGQLQFSSSTRSQHPAANSSHILFTCKVVAVAALRLNTKMLYLRQGGFVFTCVVMSGCLSL